MIKRAIRQIYDFEDEAGVVTAELKLSVNEADIPAAEGAEVNYHSRQSIEGTEYRDQCLRLDGPCWSMAEFRKDIPEEMKKIFMPGENIPHEQAAKMVKTMFEWLETLYHNKFRKVQ